ncbi:MAG: transcriptional repressor [Actinomycetota bacterium]|nr:transcriptional repressor [Actinomycetota bacterium]
MSSGHKHTKSENPDVHIEVARRFVQHDQRYSSKRRAIVSMLETSDRPLTITEILQLSKNFKGSKNAIAQSSLYRNLVVLEEVGAVQKVVSTDDNGRYELNEEILGHHHHLLCSKCGDVRDVVIPENLEKNLDVALSQIAKRSGFKLEQHRLDLIGRCKKCT